MSTILKALKKLEQEQEGQRSDLQRPGADINTRQVFNKAVRFAWIRRVGLHWFLILFVTAAIGVGGFTLIDKGKKTLSRRNVSRQQAHATDQLLKDQSPNSAEKTDAEQTKMSSSESPGLGRQSLPATAQLPKSGSQGAMTRSGNDNRQPLPRAPSPRIEKTREPHIPTKNIDTPGPAAITPSDNTLLSSNLDAKPMTDGRLKVQAIAWSSVVEERMAVINDRIVHQGDAVEGFIVVAVEPEQVVVREGQQMWAVPFGHE